MLQHLTLRPQPVGSALDVVINAAITTLYADPSGEGHLFRSFHQSQGLEGLLRPDSQMEGHLLERVYHRLYPQQPPHPRHDSSSGAYPLTTGELIRTLRILLDEEELGHIVLLGSHSEGTLNQRDITPLAYIALQVGARRPGTIPAEMLKGLSGRIWPQRLSTRHLPAVQGAIRNRHHHHGYMADYGLARRLVQEAIAHGDPCIFASWF